MENAGGVTAGTDQSSDCVVGNGCLLGGHTRQGDDPAGGIGADTAYGDIASTILLFAFFVVAAIWVKRAQKKGRCQAPQSKDEVDEWLRQDQEWHRWQDEHRRFWSNH